MARGETRSERKTRRYRIHVPVWYRTSHGHWHGGTTVDMGPAGALIRTSAPVPSVGTPIHLRIALPGDRPCSGPQIASSGRVVGIRPGGQDHQVFVAVEISRSRLWPDLRDSDHLPGERGGRRQGRTINRSPREKR
jgi:hypothetical protein